MNEPTDNMVALLQVTKSAMEMYAREHPKWFKRIEGSPIPNDVSVIMAEYIFVHLLKQERANRWSAFSEDELRELNDAGFFLQETEAELTRRAAAKQERET